MLTIDVASRRALRLLALPLLLALGVACQTTASQSPATPVPATGVAPTLSAALPTPTSVAGTSSPTVRPAATDRLGFNADGALLDANGLVIANTLNDSWLLRAAVALAPTVEASLANGSVWGPNVAAPPALDDTQLASAIGVKQPTMFDWRTTGAYYHALAMPLTQTDWTYVAALPYDTFHAAARDLLHLAVIAALVGIGVAFAAGALVAQHLARPLLRLTSASRLMVDSQLSNEQAISLTGTSDNDEVGELSRVFGHMAREVIQREVGLRSQVQALTVLIDEAKRSREVAEITESEYFQSLAQRSKDIRAKRRPNLST